MSVKTQSSIHLGDVMPDFEADSTHGKMSLYKIIGDGKYGILFSHPADFTVRLLQRNNLPDIIT